MIVTLTNTDRTEVAINAGQVTFISSVSDGTRVRFGAGRSVTVVEPVAAVVEALNRVLPLHGE